MAASVAGSLVVATRLTARKVIAAKRVTAPSIRARAFRGASQIVMVSRVEKSDADWSKELDKTSFQVLRKKGTEPAGTGEYDKFYPTEGHFVCKGCGNPLYSAESKFNSGCGWYVVLDLLFSALDSSQVTSRKSVPKTKLTHVFSLFAGRRSTSATRVRSSLKLT